MIATRGQAATAVSLLPVASAANTAGATGGWVDVRNYVGDVSIIQSVGALTGTVLGGLEDATDISGTGNAAYLPVEGAFTSVSAANNVQHRTIIASQTRGFIRYVGVVGTGPALATVNLIGQLKYS